MSVTLNLTASNINNNFSKLQKEIAKITKGVTLKVNGKDEALTDYSPDAINYLKSAIYAKECYEKLKGLYHAYESDEDAKKGDMHDNIRLIRDIKDALFDAFNNFYYKQGLLKLLHTPVREKGSRLVTEQITKKLLIPNLDTKEGILRDTKGFIEKCLGEYISDTIDNIPAKGITNLGALCYFITIIQTLNRIKPFVRELLDYKVTDIEKDININQQLDLSDKSDNYKKNLVIFCLQDIFKQLNNKQQHVQIDMKINKYNNIINLTGPDKDSAGNYFNKFSTGVNYATIDILKYLLGIFDDKINLNSFKICEENIIECNQNGAKTSHNKKKFEYYIEINTYSKTANDTGLISNISNNTYTTIRSSLYDKLDIITSLNCAIIEKESFVKYTNKTSFTPQCGDDVNDINPSFLSRNIYIENDNQYILLNLNTINSVLDAFHLLTSNIIGFHDKNRRNKYYRPVSIIRGTTGHFAFLLLNPSNSDNFNIIKRVINDGNINDPSSFVDTDNQVHVDILPTSKSQIKSHCNQNILYQRIDENDKIYLDKDLKAIFDFVFETKFQIDKAFYLINNDHTHIEENRPFLTQILDDIGIDLNQTDLGDFPYIEQQINVCDNKYATDNDYIFIKQIYQNIKTERNHLNNFIKNYESYSLKAYLDLIYNTE